MIEILNPKMLPLPEPIFLAGPFTNTDYGPIHKKVFMFLFEKKKMVISPIAFFEPLFAHTITNWLDFKFWIESMIRRSRTVLILGLPALDNSKGSHYEWGYAKGLRKNILFLVPVYDSDKNQYTILSEQEFLHESTSN